MKRRGLANLTAVALLGAVFALSDDRLLLAALAVPMLLVASTWKPIIYGGLGHALSSAPVLRACSLLTALVAVQSVVPVEWLSAQLYMAAITAAAFFVLEIATTLITIIIDDVRGTSVRNQPFLGALQPRMEAAAARQAQRTQRRRA